MAAMALTDELARIAAVAQTRSADPLAGVLAAEPASGVRYYLCAFEGEQRTWLVVDGAGEPVTRPEVVRDAAGIVAMCELAEENAGGGQLEELRQQLVTLRLTENPLGIEDAEAAALALEQTIGAPPRVAGPELLDAIGAATLALERALGQEGGSAFAEAMKAGIGTVDAFVHEVEERYLLDLGAGA
jgi:hypothetical protein